MSIRPLSYTDSDKEFLRMAVAGLHNVPDFSRSFFGGSQKRASSLLQMWREIEGEHVLSPSYRSRRQRNGSDSECISTSTSVGDGSESGDAFSQVSDEFDNQGFGGSETSENCEDNHSVISEQSRDLGEIERERVRQTFQEWTNISAKGRKGKNEIGNIETESVRILRERAQTTAQQRSECASTRVGVAEVRSQICGRKPLRKLCGRQTLLDLLLKAQNERKKELLSLSEQRPVSDFAHRNRIQVIIFDLIHLNSRYLI